MPIVDLCLFIFGEIFSERLGMTEASKTPNNSAKTCVLIIEEKADLRTFFMSTLTKSGNFEVKNAANPKESFEVLAKEAASIHLIVFDWNMQGMSGSIFAQK